MATMKRAAARTLVGLAVLAVGACDMGDPDPVMRARAARVAEDHPEAGRLWPALLKNCLRNPSCDPVGEFSDGAGQASGLSALTYWFAETSDIVEGGRDYGARVRLTLLTYRGWGGAAGRPLTRDEMQRNLRALRDGRARLTIEYRMPGQALEPYFLSFVSPVVHLDPPEAWELPKKKVREKLTERTQDLIDSWIWPNGEAGARIELSQGGTVLFSQVSPGMPAALDLTSDQEKELVSEPWIFLAFANVRDAPADALLAALRTDEPIDLSITTPDGRLIFADRIGARGFEAAASEALAALADPKIAEPLTERCASFVDWDNDAWASAAVSPAEASCDPLSEEDRARILDRSEVEVRATR